MIQRVDNVLQQHTLERFYLNHAILMYISDDRMKPLFKRFF